MLTLFLVALVRMVSTARLVHLTVALFLILAIMSCTSSSCQAGNCTVPPAPFTYSVLIHFPNMLTSVITYTTCLICTGLQASALIAGHHRGQSVYGHASRLHDLVSVALFTAKVFAQPMASRTARMPSARLLSFHTCAAARIGNEGRQLV